MNDLDQLRYPIGKFEYGKTYSLDETRKHISILDRFPKDLKKMLKKLKSGGLDMPYRPGGWTVRQVVHHLADSHVNAYIRMKLAVTESNPTIKPYNEVLWADTEDGRHAPVKVSLKIIQAIHHRWVIFLSSLRQEDLNASFYHPGNNRTFLLQDAIALYVWHSQHHLAHIALVAKSKSGKAKFEKVAPVKEPKAAEENSTTKADKTTKPAAKTKVEKAAKPAKSAEKKPRVMTEEHKAKIRAAQAKRWGKTTEDSTPVAPAAKASKAAKAVAKPKVEKAAKPAKSTEKKPRVMTEEHKAKIRAAQAKRWGKAIEPAATPAAEPASKSKPATKPKVEKVAKAPAIKAAKTPKATATVADGSTVASPAKKGRPAKSAAPGAEPKAVKAPKAAAKSADASTSATTTKKGRPAKSAAPGAEPKVVKAPKAIKETGKAETVKSAEKATVTKAPKSPKVVAAGESPKPKGRPKKNS